jgi:hypothetical protein
MLSAEWLTGPERVLRDQLENERRIQDLNSCSQSHREQTMISDPVSSVLGGVVPMFRLHPNHPSSCLSRPNCQINRQSTVGTESRYR